MKKIISLLAAFAVMFSFCTLSAYAATDVDLTINAAFGTDKIEIGADGATTLTLTFDYAKGNPIFYGELALELDGFEMANPDGEVSVYATEVNADDSAADEWEYVVKSGVLYFQSGDVGFASGLQVTFDVVADTSATKTLGITADVDTSFFGDERDKYNYVVGDINITAGCSVVEPEAPAPSVNLVEVVGEPVIVDSATTVDGEETDYQIGSGAALTVVNNNYTDMIWAITTADDTYYSDSVSVDGVDGQIKVAATFINGNKVDEGSHKTITAVGAIFKNAEGNWFTNEAYAADAADAE